MKDIGRNDDVESAPRADEKMLALLAPCRIQQSTLTDAKRRPGLFARKDRAAYREQARHVRREGFTFFYHHVQLSALLASI
jgi:uncharacterized protein (DUF58 family)